MKQHSLRFGMKDIIAGIGTLVLLGGVVGAYSLTRQATAASVELIPLDAPVRKTAVVTWVIDGDTIVVQLDGKKETIRLLGIDAPELAHDEQPGDCFAEMSSLALRRLIYGKTVLLETDPSQEDADVYGRLLRYVYLEDGTGVNVYLLSGGYAREYTFGTPYRYRSVFATQEQQAQNDQKGIWAQGKCPLPTTVR